MDHNLFSDQSPGFLIRRLQQVSVALFIRSLKEFDLTPLQYTILSIIKREKNIDQISIARQSILDTSTVRDIVERLEDKGLIQRTVGERDRRTRNASITKAGEQTLEAASPNIRITQSELLSPLTAKEARTFISLLEKMVSTHEASSKFERVKDIWRR